MPRWQHGEVLLAPYDCTEALLRGHLTTAEAKAEIEGYDDRLEAVGEAVHTWAHTGICVDEDGDTHFGAVYYGNHYKGKRGSFAVTEMDTRRTDHD